jgi:hypothetical protein
MGLITYKTKRFRQSSLDTIETATEIIGEYAAEGYDLTLRQLYYQFVARALIPNKDSEYKKLGSIINDARLAGLLDWDAIVDRTRVIRGNNHWESPQEVVDACAEQFRLDTRKGQKYYVEVWVEKDALVGVLEGVCTKLDVKYFSCRGYVSQSAMWRAAQRMQWESNPIVLHLGDHDPSGIDMTRDIQERLELLRCPATVERIALNMEQVEKFQPPPNPAKITDSRYGPYVVEYGEESWELDALDPRKITGLIRKSVDEYTNQKARKTLMGKESQHKDELRYVAERWGNIVKGDLL